MESIKTCMYCNNEIIGRTDKKYCDQFCKSAFHYRKSQIELPSFFSKVDKQLRLNRKLLKQFNKGGKSTVRTGELIKLGFDPNFFTHYWKTSKADVYLFVYEYGFLHRTENSVDKFVLVKWQKYMEK